MKNSKFNLHTSVAVLAVCCACTGAKDPTSSDTLCGTEGSASGGTLAVTVPGKECAAVKCIRVSSEQMKGDSAITLTCQETVQISGDKTFYIAIPARSYEGLMIEISPDGMTYTKCMATKDANPICIGAGETTPIRYAANAVRLWEGSPYWSLTNLGESTEDGHTCTYAWSDSIVPATWGKNWRLPKKEEMDILLQKPTYESCGQVGGWTVCGTANTYYAGNRIFLPAASSDPFFARASYFSGLELSREQAWLVFLSRYGNGYRRCWNQSDKILRVFMRPVLTLD